MKKLEKILRGQWPGSDIKVHVFGSSGNLLCTTDSDGPYVTLDHDGQELRNCSGYMYNYIYESFGAGVLAG